MSKRLLKVITEGPKYIGEINMKDYEKEQRNKEQVAQDFQDAELRLNQLNHRLVSVNNRLQDNFKKRIDSLNSHNTKTNEIKLKMQQWEQEQKEKNYSDYLTRQMEHMKRIKKNQK